MTSNLWTTKHPIDCNRCQTTLADYVRLELNGREVDQLYPDIAFHLETCEQCEAVYYREFRSQGRRKPVAELQQLGQRVGVAEVMQQIMPPAAPEPPAPKPGWVAKALEQGQAWLDEETDRWRQLWLSLPTLGRSLPPAPALAGLMTEIPVPLSSRQGVTWIAPAEAQFELQLAVKSDPAEQDRCQLEVAVTLKDRFGDFSGVKLTLLWGERAQLKVTDAQGEVTFSGLPVDQLPAMRLLVTLPD